MIPYKNRNGKDYFPSLGKFPSHCILCLLITQSGTQDGIQSGTQDDTEGDTQMTPKNKYLIFSTILYLPKTNLGSLLITSKLPMVYERRILVLLLKSYIQYILCIYVYMYSRIHEYTFKPILATQRL